MASSWGTSWETSWGNSWGENASQGAAWGSSWGNSWGVSWGSGVPPPPIPPYRQNDGRVFFPTVNQAPLYDTKVSIYQACSMFLPTENASDFEDVTLNFTKPDGKRYIVVSTYSQPLTYTIFVRDQKYLVYTLLSGELSQAGKWTVFYVADEDYVSSVYRFTIFS